MLHELIQVFVGAALPMFFGKEDLRESERTLPVSRTVARVPRRVPASASRPHLEVAEVIKGLHIQLKVLLRRQQRRSQFSNSAAEYLRASRRLSSSWMGHTRQLEEFT